MITCPVENCNMCCDRNPRIGGVRLTLEEEALNKLQVFCDNDTWALIERYQTDLSRRSKECESSLGNLKGAKEELNRDERKNTKELEEVCERRMSELQGHYDGMKKVVKEKFQKRRDDLSEAIEKVEQILRNVQYSIEEMKEFIIRLSRVRNNALDYDTIQEIRRKANESEQQKLEIEAIQGMSVKIDAESDLNLTDAIDISPPDPISILKTKEVLLIFLFIMGHSYALN